MHRAVVDAGVARLVHPAQRVLVPLFVVALTRLGIAQFDQGKYAEAKASFDKVEGARQAIANLWTVYAQQKGG